MSNASWRVRQSHRPVLRGFTLVQLLMVIGIIALLMALIMPAVARARRAAARARTTSDLQTLAAGLQAYHDIYNAYPPVDNTPPAAAANRRQAASGDDLVYDNGTHSLYTALAVPFSVRDGSAPYGPLVNVEQFRVKHPVNGPGGTKTGEFLDSNDNPYLYIPAGPTRAIAATTGAPFVDNSVALNATGQPLYNWNATGMVGLTIKSMRRILGDDNADGRITPPGTNPPEQPAYTGPYLLWAAGPDGVWGLGADTGPQPTDSQFKDTDDVTNFEMPANLRR